MAESCQYWEERVDDEVTEQIEEAAQVRGGVAMSCKGAVEAVEHPVQDPEGQ